MSVYSYVSVLGSGYLTALVCVVVLDRRLSCREYELCLGYMDSSLGYIHSSLGYIYSSLGYNKLTSSRYVCSSNSLYLSY